MKTPTIVVTTYDWESIFTRLKAGEIPTFEDMTATMMSALKMWMRNHKGYGLKTRSLLTGGYQLQLGMSLKPTAKRSPK